MQAATSDDDFLSYFEVKVCFRIGCNHNCPRNHLVF